jgi:hypothetical protein
MRYERTIAITLTILSAVSLTTIQEKRRSYVEGLEEQVRLLTGTKDNTQSFEYVRKELGLKPHSLITVNHLEKYIQENPRLSQH